MRHGTDSVVAVSLLYHGSISIQRLDREPFLIEIVHIFLKARKLANCRIARGLAILQRKLIGHVGNGFKSLAQTGAFDTACADFKRIELIVFIENKVDLNRQFTEHIYRNHHSFADMMTVNLDTVGSSIGSYINVKDSKLFPAKQNFP